MVIGQDSDAGKARKWWELTLGIGLVRGYFSTYDYKTLKGQSRSCAWWGVANQALYQCAVCFVRKVQISVVSKRIILHWQVLSRSGGVSSSGLSSQLWAGFDQEHTGQGGGYGAENWWLGGVAGKLWGRLNSHKGLLKLAVDLARTCHFQGGQIINWEWTYIRQVEITMQGQGGASRFVSWDARKTTQQNFFSTDIEDTEKASISWHPAWKMELLGPRTCAPAAFEGGYPKGA